MDKDPKFQLIWGSWTGLTSTFVALLIVNWLYRNFPARLAPDHGMIVAMQVYREGFKGEANQNELLGFFGAGLGIAFTILMLPKLLFMKARDSTACRLLPSH